MWFSGRVQICKASYLCFIYVWVKALSSYDKCHVASLGTTGVVLSFRNINGQVQIYGICL